MGGSCGTEGGRVGDVARLYKTVKLDFKETHWVGVDLIKLADYSSHWQGVL